MITAILLASGYSKRLNDNKLLLDFHGKPIISHMMNMINTYPFEEKLLVQREDDYTNLALDYHFTCLSNPNASTGQSASVRIGVEYAAPMSALMFFVGDQPCLTSDIIKTLIRNHEKYPNDIIVPMTQAMYRNPVIFPARFRKELLQLDGDRGGRRIIKRYPEYVRTVNFENSYAFQDIDTLADYQTLLYRT